MSGPIAKENLVSINSVDKTSRDEDLPVCLKRFGHLVLSMDSSSDSEPADSQPLVATSQTGRHNANDDVRDDLHHASGLPTPRNSSLVAPTCTPRPQHSVSFDEDHLSDASDTSSFYDGHYKSDAWCFPRGGKMTQMPGSDEAMDGILDEFYDADDELRTNTTEDTSHSTEAGSEFNITNLFRKMMFVSGETAEPSIETTTLIEDITREQVLEIVRSHTPHPYPHIS